MTCITRVAADADLEKPQKRFRGGFSKVRANPETVDRQARITLLAFQGYDDRAHALAFLNEHSEELGGRPLDLAGRDPAGLADATALLATRVPPRS